MSRMSKTAPGDVLTAGHDGDLPPDLVATRGSERPLIIPPPYLRIPVNSDPMHCKDVLEGTFRGLWNLRRMMMSAHACHEFMQRCARCSFNWLGVLSWMTEGLQFLLGTGDDSHDVTELLALTHR